MTDQQENKQRAIDLLESRYRGMENACEGIDMRLRMYFEDLLEHSSAREDDPNDWHGLYELLGAAKFLRCLDTYNFNTKKVQTVIRLREGEWRQDGGVWRHISGGLKCPGIAGGQVYRWAPFQVFALASIYGFYAWIDTQMPAGSKPQLLRTEREKDGTIWDYRRLCTDFTLTGSRKIDKTGFGGFIGVEFMLFEDYNMEGFCCANSEDQAKIIFRRIKYLLSGLDTENRFRLTESLAAWRDKYSEISTASIRPMTAGGKFKDGWYAQLCLKDEFGAAPYANGKSDMKMLVDVIESSMGPRREPLSVTMTSAGRITEGPFIQILDGLHGMLEREQSIAKGEVQPVLTDDRTMTLLLEPDAWQKEEQYLLTNKTVRHKINPMLGTIVQHQFYDDQIAKAQRDGDTGEVIAKLFNVYSSGKIQEWIKPEQVRPLQTDRRIDDCKAQEGWVIFTGLDFSQGNDLHTASYLAARRHPSGRGTEFFADCDAWIKEETLERSAIRPLYETWIEQGWLHVSEGKVFQPSMFIARTKELLGKGCQFMYWGYDKYKSKDPINSLLAFLQSDMNVQKPEMYVQVVSQLNSEFNAPTDDLYAAMFAPVPFISFSPSPLWPWCFGNCVLEIDGRENKRPVKRSQSDSCKVDPVQALIMAMDLYTRFEGTRQ